MKRLFCALVAFLLLAGCYPRQEPPPDLDQFVVETLVAATLTAEVSPKDQPLQPAETDMPAQDDSSQQPSLTPTLTQTPTETFTPTVSLTPTLVPGDPAALLGVPSFKDTFDGEDNFYLYDESQSSYQVEDGQMVMVAKKANSYETWSLSWGDLKNFYLEITGTFGEECSGKDRYGMIFRAPDTSQGYLISISCDGSTRLSLWDDDAEEYNVIKKWTTSEHINSGPGGVNRLGIRAKGTKLTGFINGHQVFEKSNSKFTKGRFGVMVAASDTVGFTAYLSQVVYWKLP